MQRASTRSARAELRRFLAHPLHLNLSKGLCISLALSLAGCSSHNDASADKAGQDRIACAVGGSRELADVCTVERSERDGKLTLIVHDPDGAFRRFDVMTDGTGLAVADGADKAQSKLVNGKLDITVGDDRYVFPATTKNAVSTHNLSTQN